jgi:hypothetical protein
VAVIEEAVAAVAGALGEAAAAIAVVAMAVIAAVDAISGAVTARLVGEGGKPRGLVDLLERPLAQIVPERGASECSWFESLTQERIVKTVGNRRR